MHALTACVCQRNGSIWGQMCTKHCSWLALAHVQNLICICCNNNLSVGDMESRLQILAEQDKKNAKD